MSSSASQNLIPALVLSAGLSTRMQTLKPLVPLGGRPLIHHVLQSLLDSKVIAPIFVVTGHKAALIEASLNAFSHPAIQPDQAALLHPIFNPHYAAGEMLSSLRAGIAALPKSAPAFLLAFADQPAISPAVIRSLVEYFHSHKKPPPLAIPVYREKRGHPILLSTSLISEIEALAPADSLKTVVYRHLSEAALLPVDDPAILEDLDTPEELARAQERVLPK